MPNLSSVTKNTHHGSSRFSVTVWLDLRGHHATMHSNWMSSSGKLNYSVWCSWPFLGTIPNYDVGEVFGHHFAIGQLIPILGTLIYPKSKYMISKYDSQNWRYGFPMHLAGPIRFQQNFYFHKPQVLIIYRQIYSAKFKNFVPSKSIELVCQWLMYPWEACLLLRQSKVKRWHEILAFLLSWFTLQWRRNEHDGVPNHQRHDYLPNRLFKRRSKKTSKLRVTGLCDGNSSVTGEFPAQRASNAENVSIWWRHHEPMWYRKWITHWKQRQYYGCFCPILTMQNTLVPVF